MIEQMRSTIITILIMICNCVLTNDGVDTNSNISILIMNCNCGTGK